MNFLPIADSRVPPRVARVVGNHTELLAGHPPAVNGVIPRLDDLHWGVGLPRPVEHVCTIAQAESGPMPNRAGAVGRRYLR